MLRSEVGFGLAGHLQQTCSFGMLEQLFPSRNLKNNLFFHLFS